MRKLNPPPLPLRREWHHTTGRHAPLRRPAGADQRRHLEFQLHQEGKDLSILLANSGLISEARLKNKYNLNFTEGNPKISMYLLMVRS